MIKEILTIPSAEKLPADAQMRGKLLNLLLLGMVGMATLVFLGLIIFGISLKLDIPFIFYFSTALVIVGGIFSYWINRQGKVYWGGISFIILVIVAVTISDTPKEVLVGRSLIFFIIPVMMSSVLLRSYATFIVATLLTIEHALLWTFLDVGITFNPFGMIAFYSFAYIGWLGARALEEAIAETREINLHLDELVSERTKELTNANKRLQELDALKSKFVSDVSHELRTPISNMSIYLEMLEDMFLNLSNTIPAKAINFMSTLRSETNRLTELINDILNVSRLEQAIVNIKTESVAISPLLTEIVEANRPKAERQNLNLEIKNIPQNAFVQADADQLRQVFTNLIANAINYTESGSVRISAKKDQGEIKIQIQDTGMGVDVNDIPHIFERFYRGQQASRSSMPGTGLGLAISKEIIEAHGGSIHVESELNVGSTFIVNLPIHQNNEANHG